MKKRAKFLFGPALALPFVFLIPILIGTNVADYSSIGQHISELHLADLSPLQSFLYDASLFLIGVLSLAFSLGLVAVKRKLSFTSFAAFLYSLGMLSNAVFPMGSPLHGFYGLPIFSIALPALFAIEYQADVRSTTWFSSYSMVTTLLNLVYLWIMLFGLDPQEYRGVTQRIAIYVLNTWLAVAAYLLATSNLTKNPPGAVLVDQ